MIACEILHFACDTSTCVYVTELLTPEPTDDDEGIKSLTFIILLD